MDQSLEDGNTWISNISEIQKVKIKSFIRLLHAFTAEQYVAKGEQCEESSLSNTKGKWCDKNLYCATCPAGTIKICRELSSK